MVIQMRTGERLRLLREREVHGFFQPWLAAHGSPFSVASNVDSIAVQELAEVGHNAQRSSDKTLSAFAQLATLRLNVRRAMVSLIDEKYQYILTEATKSQSFLADESRGADDGLWLGTSILLRDEAVCHNCFDSRYTAEDGKGATYETKALLVSDCRLDDRFKDKSYVISEPGVRFYAGVPIVTRDGFPIGVYAISDESPREGLSIEDIKFMEDIASAIMEHLEWARDRVDRFKGDRLTRGLAQFISPAMRDRSDEHPIGLATTSRTGDSHMERVYAEMRADFNADHAPGKRIAYLGREDSAGSESSDSDTQEIPDHGNQVTTSSDDREGHDETTRVLIRAAKSLRRCALADGVIFFDARPDGDGTAVDAASHAKILSLSLKSRAESDIASRATLSKATLRHYFDHFPSGRSFDFTADGNEINTSFCSEEGCCSGSGDSKDAKAGTKRKRSEEKIVFTSHHEILQQVPRLRKLIFLPLRDFITGQDIAGCFLWTNTFGRIMNMEDDLPQLNAFANGIVSEVVRTQAEQLNKSKTAFIASMSHELRSPLHGILGSVEFLNDTSTDTYQSGLLSSIVNCSKTLLDTLSNLLSYAKVTQTSMIASLEPVDLALLVEEVVEAVCAGNTYRQEHTASITAIPSHQSPDMMQRDRASSRRQSLFTRVSSGTVQQVSNVSILIDIMDETNWIYTTNPGALRRVVLNLVGNAIKYTTRGFISISLRKIDVKGKEQISLEVVDTGKGISGSFLKNNLFKPFKQEDHASSGTGLGLSIVKQLVESLGGTIEVRSALEKGTEFHIHLPLESSREKPSLMHMQSADPLLDTALKTEGRTMNVVNPDDAQSAATSLANVRLRHNLSDLCSSWFHFDVEKPNSRSRSGVDFLIVTRAVRLKPLLEKGNAELEDLPKVVIVICISAAEASAVSQELAGEDKLDCIVEVISQPCGPRKLARTFARCLRRLEDFQSYDADRAFSMQAPALPPLTPISPRSKGEPKIFPSADANGNGKVADPLPVKKRILVVDDNKVNLDLMVKFVSKHRLPHATATNGLEALVAYKSHLEKGEKFDWVLIDISMPVMDGLEASREIRKAEEEHGMEKARIVALTGHDTSEMQRRAKEEGSGVDTFLNKPIRFELLREILEKDFG